MALLDVRPVFVVQDRASGAFVDINMSFVTSLRHAARSESRQIAVMSMHSALYENQIECPEGFEVHEIFERNV